MRWTGRHWEHADPFACGGALNIGRCRHMNELNEETRQVVAYEPGTDALVKIEELETQAIIAGLEGRVTKTWVYDIPKVGVNLSVIGVEQAAREMAKRGEAIREVSVVLSDQNDFEAFFIAQAKRYAVNAQGVEVELDSAIRGKRQPKFIRLKSGEHQFNPHWYEVGITKAIRNAKLALIDEEVRQHVIAEATGKIARRQSAPPVPKTPPTKTAPEPEPPAPPPDAPAEITSGTASTDRALPVRPPSE